MPHTRRKRETHGGSDRRKGRKRKKERKRGGCSLARGGEREGERESSAGSNEILIKFHNLETTLSRVLSGDRDLSLCHVAGGGDSFSYWRNARMLPCCTLRVAIAPSPPPSSTLLALFLSVPRSCSPFLYLFLAFSLLFAIASPREMNASRQRCI